MTAPGERLERPEESVTLAEVLGLVARRRWTLVASTVGAVLLALAFVATSRPAYRASATVLIDEGGPTTGLLADLAALSSAPAAASEMAILRSRQVAEQVARRPEGFDPADPAAFDDPLHLGLATRVDDERLAPARALLAAPRLGGLEGPRPRVWARALEPGAPARLRLEVRAGRVRVGPAGWLARLVGPAAAEIDPGGGPARYEGVELRVHLPSGLADGAWALTVQDERAAVEELIESTDVVELELASGVVGVTVEDSDPFRAARIANALCASYLALNVAHSREGLGQATEFIDAQLEEQIAALERAEGELVELKSAEPQAIDLEASARATIEQLGALEAERVRAELAATALSQALERLEAGELEALSRVSADEGDAVTRAWLEEITRLAAEAELQERADAGPSKLILAQKRAELSAQREALGLEHGTLVAALEELEAGHEGAFARLAGLPPDAITESYLAELARVRSLDAELARRLTPEHPERVATGELRAELVRLLCGQLESRAAGTARTIDELERLDGAYAERLGEHAATERGRIREAVAELVVQATAHLRSRLAGVAAHRAALEDQIAALEARLGRLPELQRTLAEPLRRVATHTRIVELLLEARQEAEVTRASTLASARVLDPAEPPLERHFPRTRLTLLFAAALGLGVGAVIALLCERVVQRVHSEADLAHATGLPVVAAIPDFRRGRARARGAGRDFLPLRDGVEGPVAEAYRSLRASLRFCLGGEREPRTVAITSCAPSEGKTSTSLDLAIVYARKGARTIVVDADLRRPAVHRYLGIENGDGLAEALEGRAGWRELVRPSGIEGLSALTAGRGRGNAADLLEGGRLRSLLDELTAEHDVVVFDLPPAIVASDVAGLVPLLDAVLFLHRVGGVPLESVRRTTGLLRRSGANLVGAVLCRVRLRRSESQYYSDYGRRGEGDARAA